MKLYHMADLCLDTVFPGVPVAVAAVRRRALYDVLSAVCDRIEKEAIPLFLIAGDLVDAENANRETAAFLSACFARIPACEVVIAPGEKDPASYYAKLSLPENVHVFDKAGITYFDLDKIGVRVYGYGFTTPSLPLCPTPGVYPQTSHTKVFCAHGDFGASSSDCCPIPSYLPGSLGCVYAALGHIHNAPPAMETEDCLCAYPGTPQGLSHAETGERHILEVDLDPVVKLTPIPTYRFRYETLEVDLTGADDANEVKDLLTETVDAQGYDAGTALEIVLTGKTAPALLLDNVRPDTAITDLEIVNETEPDLSGLFDEADETLRGQFCRKLRPLLESEDETTRKRAIRALRYGLFALTGEKPIDF